MIRSNSRNRGVSPKLTPLTYLSLPAVNHEMFKLVLYDKSAAPLPAHRAMAPLDYRTAD
jgi:hypothetical protein